MDAIYEAGYWNPSHLALFPGLFGVRDVLAHFLLFNVNVVFYCSYIVLVLSLCWTTSYDLGTMSLS
jgi:hypothetical protein